MSRIELELQPRQLLVQWMRCGMTADWLASYMTCELEPGARSAAKNVLSTVINELLENAVKFCSNAEGSIRVAVECEHRTARVETWNRALEERARVLEETLAELERGGAQALFMQRTTQSTVAGAPGIGIIIVQRDHGARVQANVTRVEDAVEVHLRAELELPGAG